MPSSAHVRLEIENSLRSHMAGALSPRSRTARPRSPVGIPEIDDLLGGGFPVGAITELVGASCSGRTSLALAFAAELTRAGQTSAWVDVADALDPESAAAAGVDLSRQLWVRCGAGQAAFPARDPAQAASAPGLLCAGAQLSSPSGGGGSPHPRHEVNGMPAAIEAFLQKDRQNDQQKGWRDDPNAPEAHFPAPVTRIGENPGEARRHRKKIGTPGMPNRPVQSPILSRIVNREEQPPTDRLPPRRGQHFHQEPRHPSTTMARCAETPTMRLEARQASVRPAPELNKAALPAGFSSDWKHGRGRPAGTQTWGALDQALRAVDLLLNAGGFGVIVLDLGSTPAEFAWRIPMATWFRFRAAADRSRTSVLLLTQHPCARSSAELVLRLAQASPVTAGSLFTGITHELTISRQRFEAVEESEASSQVLPMRKPPQSERSLLWSRSAAWSPFAVSAPVPDATGMEVKADAQVPSTVPRAVSWTVLKKSRPELRETPENLVAQALRSA